MNSLKYKRVMSNTLLVSLCDSRQKTDSNQSALQMVFRNVLFLESNNYIVWCWENENESLDGS